MSNSHPILSHKWKIIPIAILFILWTFYGLHRQYTQGPETQFDAKAIPDYKTANETFLEINTIPEEQQTTLLKEASIGEKTDLLGETDLSGEIPNLHETLIVYAYSESDNARENLRYFLRKGVHGKADFMFIFNGETDAQRLLPDISNVKYVKRENKCYDLGTMGEVLSKDDLWKGYKRFITLNASIRGPFLPTYSRSSCWSDIFLSRISKTVKVCAISAEWTGRELIEYLQLVGTTMNCQPSPHVQSMLLATDYVGMSILLNPALADSVSQNNFFGSMGDPTGFTPCYKEMRQAIHGEIGLTELIRKQGYEVDALLTAFQAKSPTDYCEKNGNPEDILWEAKYYGSNVHPYELVFIKANRNIDTRLLEVMTIWHLQMNDSAWDTCGGGAEQRNIPLEDVDTNDTRN